MSILTKIKKHHKDKTNCTLIREIEGHPVSNIGGYIVDYSKHFLVLQETDDFLLKGFKVLPLETIVKVRHNGADKYYDQIMRNEKVWDTIEYTHQLDLTNWSTIFTSIRDLGFNVIIENEHAGKETFDIGPIAEVHDKHLKTRYFNAEGMLSSFTTKFKWKHITLVAFDDRYINIFSKYLRELKN